MINVFIADTLFSVASNPCDITLECAIALEAEAEEYAASPKTDKDRYAFSKKTVALISDIPEEYLDKIDESEIITAASVFSADLFDLINQKPYRQDTPFYEGAAFVADGEEFFIPVSEYDAAGESVPLTYISARELCEVTDLYNAEGIYHIPAMAAILCSRERGAYNMGTIGERVDKIKKMPFAAALEIRRLIEKAHGYFRNFFPNCYHFSGNTVAAFGNEPVSWCDLVKLVAGCRPADLEVAERMNCRDFLSLADTCQRYSIS